jgi:single-stranded DNA-binding protein
VVEGKLSTREWQDDGNKRTKIEMTVERVHFCGSKQSSGGGVPNVEPQDTGFSEVPDDCELPF